MWRSSYLSVLSLALSAISPTVGSAQDPPPVSIEFDSAESKRNADDRATKAGVYRLKVWYVKVEARWAEAVQLPLRAGDLLTREKIFLAMEALEAQIARQVGFGLRSKGEIGVLHIDVDFDQTPAPADAPGTVGVIFRPRHVGVSLVRIGDNVIPIPRSPLPTFYDNVPAPLRALNPTFGMSYDRAFGAALGAAIATDLLNLRDPAGASASTGPHRLDVRGGFTKALDESFYRANGDIGYRMEWHSTTLRELSLRAGYDGAQEPQGQGEHTHQAGSLLTGIALKLAPNTRLHFDTGYRHTEDTVQTSPSARETHTSADEQTNRVLFDLIPPTIFGFVRAALWEDNGWLGGGGAYQRLAGRAGYAKEIPVAPSQTIGLEVVVGGGGLWGDAPEYARFFGGASPGSFLYDGPASRALLDGPAGPLIRSFGEREAGLKTRSGTVRGGDAFWHFNLTLALPIPKLSRPLIPDVSTDLPGPGGEPFTLKQLITTQIERSGPAFATEALKSQGVPPAEAERQVNEMFQEITPATRFIVNDASFWAVKPVLLLDAGGLWGGGDSENWLAAGAGLQVTVVVAKFEAGYVHTVKGPTFGSSGAAFFRLVFQNLF